MESFLIYLKLGFEHITDINGYDHILFILALCIIYSIREWKKVLILITAFTLGHSLTLGLAVLEIIHVDSALIEFLIPITIILTCLTNVMGYKHRTISRTIYEPSNIYLQYALAVIFGLIHGMGFSNYLKSLLGKGESIVLELFAFNVGLEIGQLLIVGGSFILALLFLELINVRRSTWVMVCSGFIAGLSFHLLLDKWYF
jgi:hypothetical protein